MPWNCGAAHGARALVCVALLCLTTCTNAPPHVRSGRGTASTPAATGSTSAPTGVQTVTATVETEPVAHAGDAADDVAIWVNPEDPSASTIIGTDKKGALVVYDLHGHVLQTLPVGDVNNVDLRAVDGRGRNPRLGGGTAAVVAATNRSSDTIELLGLDPATGRLHDVAARHIAAGISVYGLCMYRSAADGSLYVFVNDKTGLVQQWALRGTGSGTLDARTVRTFHVGSETEGCVADDEDGAFYISEEDVGIWRYGAEPSAGTARRQVHATSATGPLVADVEGLTIAHRQEGADLLIASSQGSSSYAVFTTGRGNELVATFAIGSGDGVDGTQHTDGIDATTAGLGPAFPRGVFIAQDGENDSGNQNFKLVPFERIEAFVGRR